MTQEQMGDLGDSYRQFREHKNSIRSLRNESFENGLLLELKSKFDVFEGKNSNWIIDSPKGVIDYFPKSKKLLIRESNSWIKDGDIWMKENIL